VSGWKLEVASNEASNAFPIGGMNFAPMEGAGFSKRWIEHECGSSRNAPSCRIRHADLASPPYNLMDNQEIDIRVTARNLEGGQQMGMVSAP